jgi:hypothetical protein
MGGLNQYQYCPNPVEWVDPLGLSCKENTWNEFQKDHKGQFSNSTEASKAYKELKDQESPWPIGYDPQHRTMKVDDTFNMALSPGQPLDRPGGFGTYDTIDSVEHVRDQLAVKEVWKPQVDRVVTYRVKKPLPVLEGPVGPQIDGSKYLTGGGHQIEMDVPARNRMDYLEVVGVKSL